MKYIIFWLLFIGFVSINLKTYGQEEFFKNAPFNSGVYSAIYIKDNNQFYCKIYFDKFGERYSVDISKENENSEVFKSIIKKEGSIYYIMHKKKKVVKIPVKEHNFYFDTSALTRVSDTLYLGYQASYYTDKIDSIEAIYFDNLLLFLKAPNNGVSYKVSEIAVGESFPEYVFFLPRGFTLTKMNYNFRE